MLRQGLGFDNIIRFFDKPMYVQIPNTKYLIVVKPQRLNKYLLSKMEAVGHLLNISLQAINSQ